jgi:hypothetical protein
LKQKKLLYFLLLSFFFLVLVSADKKEKKSLFYYNSFKKLDGIKLSHKPGIYSKPIELNIKVEKDKKITIETISNSISTISGVKFLINKPTVVKISSIGKDGIKHFFVGTYLVGIKHDLPIVSLVVDHNDFFPPNGIYDGTLEKSSPDGKSITKGRAWDKKPITGFAQFFFLNDLKEEDGGATTFIKDTYNRIYQDYSIIPKVGRVLLFEHDIEHEGSILKNGLKYCIRTDVMYSIKKK